MSTGNKKEGLLSRVDLLDALRSGDDSRVQVIAKQLMLREEETLRVDQAPSDDTLDAAQKNELFEQVVSETERYSAGFWRLVRHESFDIPDQQDTTETTLPNIEWTGRPKQPPKYELLQSAEYFIRSSLAPLFQAVNSVSGKLDTPKLVKQLSEAKPLKRLPKKPKRVSEQLMHVIDDRHSHLIPYWTDNSVYRYLSLAWRGESASEAILPAGGSRPYLFGQSSKEAEWQVPMAGSLVIVFSDLGALLNQGDSLIDTWLQLGQELQQGGVQAVAFLPCCVSLCDARLKDYYTLISLVPLERPPSNEEQQFEQLSLLQAALSPAIRLEPGLVRQMRLEMAKHGEHWQVGAGIESMFWQHDYLQDDHSVAATWRAEARTQKLKQFSQFSPEEKETALAVLRQWREPLSQRIWFEEIISLDGGTQELISEEVGMAENYFSQLSHAVQDDALLETELATKEWLQRLMRRIPETVIGNAPIGNALQRIKHKVLPKDLDNIDPRSLPASNNKTVKVLLYQQGNLIKVMLFKEQFKPPVGFSPIGITKMAHDLLQVKVGGQAIGHLSLKDNAGLPLPIGIKRLEVTSDRETLNLELFEKNDWSFWSNGVARDRYGLYTDLSITPKITQRFRWINPGTFQMGSPETELERYDDEDLHEVTLSTGYWLADTTVTQEQWQAITRENPSHFKGESLPVETVSWDDSKRFIQQLNKRHETLTFQLPTEAQWEYACRAGTTTPFSLGQNVTPEQVSYDGEVSYNQGQKGESRDRTVPVKSLPANPWGLFEMHGNVEEWCWDQWQENLGKDPAIDPKYEQGGKRPGRVVRGGSWINGGRGARSAFRSSDSPDFRSYSIGLRLSLGQPSGSSRGGSR